MDLLLKIGQGVLLSLLLAHHALVVLNHGKVLDKVKVLDLHRGLALLCLLNPGQINCLVLVLLEQRNALIQYTFLVVG